jgi:hypothetical protein
MQDQPDQTTLSMCNDADGLIMSKARDATAIDNLEDASFYFYGGLDLWNPSMWLGWACSGSKFVVSGGRRSIRCASKRSNCGVEMWRGGVGAAYRLPALSSAGASLAGGPAGGRGKAERNLA